MYVLISGLEMSITPDAITFALSLSPYKLLSVCELVKRLGLDDDFKVSNNVCEVVRSMPQLKLVRESIVIVDPQWVTTLLVEIVLQWKECLGANCPACMLRQEIWPGSCQERILPPGVAASILDAAIDDSTCEREYSRDAYALGLVSVSFLYSVAEQYALYTDPNVKLAKSVKSMHGFQLSSIANRLLGFHFEASSDYAKVTGFYGMYTFIPALVSTSQPAQYFEPCVMAEFTITVPNQPLALGMAVYNRVRMPGMCSLDSIWDCVVITATHFRGRFIWKGWGIDIHHSDDGPVVVQICYPQSVHGKKLRVIDDIVIGINSITDNLTGSTVQITEWNLDCENCHCPTWSDLSNTNAGCDLHHLTKHIPPIPL